MRIARNMRQLSRAEISLAESVFADSLPSWSKILITDGLGPIPQYDNPYTVEATGIFLINVGPEVYPDATIPKDYDGYGDYDAIFIHEMTHVWQLHRGYWVILRSFWANTAGAGYPYTPGDPWDSYNVEQQAHLVEDWYKFGASPGDPRYPYIEKIIRAGVEGGFFRSMSGTILMSMTADQLRHSKI